MKKKQALRRWDVTGKRQLEMVNFELPRIQAGDLHLEFLANGVCGSDTHMFHTGAVHPGHAGGHHSLTLGHELIARVKRVGRNVAGFKVGDIVAVEPGLPCGTCPNCLKGRYHCCPKTKYMGTPPQDGGLADEFYWPARWCHKLPAKLAKDPVLASLVEPLAACRQSWALRNKLVDLADDEWTIITGTGAMALGVLAIIKASNPKEKVMVLGRGEAALKFATEYGADATLQLSGVNPERIAATIAAELDPLVETNHFDDDSSVCKDVCKTKAGKKAVQAALAAVRECRSRGAHKPVILQTLTEAARKAAEDVMTEENTAVFKHAQEMANGFISSVFECTGSERLLETLFNSRCMLANGAIIGLGCHYGVHFDVAMLRRFELAFQPVRRSCNQFPATLELLNDRPEFFAPLVGGTASFEDFGKLMFGEVQRAETGTGGPKTVIVRS